MGKAPIAVALDGPDLGTIRGWIDAVSPHVSTLKVGLETYLRDGAAAVDAAKVSGCQLFLDLKLHDIPNTVGGAARSIAHFEPTYLTVHALGGADMIAAAAKELPNTRITAVTILTSMDEAALQSIGIKDSALDAAVRLAKLAVTAGARAIVCSPHEVAAIRAVVPQDIHLITPGVRPAGSDAGDQKRIATPEQAIADGADIVVIGRPITGATDPGTAAAAIGATL